LAAAGFASNSAMSASVTRSDPSSSGMTVAPVLPCDRLSIADRRQLEESGADDFSEELGELHHDTCKFGHMCSRQALVCPHSTMAPMAIGLAANVYRRTFCGSFGCGFCRRHGNSSHQNQRTQQQSRPGLVHVGVEVAQRNRRVRSCMARSLLTIGSARDPPRRPTYRRDIGARLLRSRTQRTATTVLTTGRQ